MEANECLKLATIAVRVFQSRYKGVPGECWEDMLSAAAVIVLRLAPEYDATLGSPSTYFVKRTVLRLLDWKRQATGGRWRSLRRPTTRRLSDDEDDQPPDGSPAVEAGQETADTLAALRRAAGERDWPILRAIVEGREIAWVAEQMGTSRAMVQWRKRRLLDRLRTAEVLELLE